MAGHAGPSSCGVVVIRRAALRRQPRPQSGEPKMQKAALNGRLQLGWLGLLVLAGAIGHRAAGQSGRDQQHLGQPGADRLEEALGRRHHGGGAAQRAVGAGDFEASGGEEFLAEGRDDAIDAVQHGRARRSPCRTV